MYSLAHLHLLVNHTPIIFTALGLLFIFIAALRRRDDMARLGLGFFLAGALMAIPTYFTGDPAAGMVRHMPGVTRVYIHNHEEAATSASIVVGILGLFSLWALWKYRKPVIVPRWVVVVALVGGLLGSTAMARTGLLGGEIRHTEVRADTTTPAPMAPAAP